MLPEPERRPPFCPKTKRKDSWPNCRRNLADMARFRLETGLWQANVTGLLWNQLDLVRKVAWIHPDQVKDKESHRGAALSDVAVEIIWRQIGRNHPHVFSDRGNSGTQANTKAWRTARER